MTKNELVEPVGLKRKGALIPNNVILLVTIFSLNDQSNEIFASSPIRATSLR